MKTGNVILAIFLWLCIPASFIFGGLFGLFGGGIGGGVICAIGAPLIFFILGLIVLLTGREKNFRPSSSQHVVVQQQTIPNRTYHSSIEEYCQMCGKPKGFQQFYLVTRGNKSLNVCEHCADEIDKEDDKLKNKKQSVAECEICGELKDPRLLKVVLVDGNEFFLCEKCRNNVNEKTEQKSQDEAIKIIKLRYAKGEITKEQFEQMKKDLNN
jgi:uncharacterized membrane protein